MLASSVASWAQAADPAAAPAHNLPPVVVTDKADAQARDQLQTTQTQIGRGTQDIRDIPQSLNVITEKLMNDAKLDTLQQALHYSAGITFAAAENGTDQDIRLRGFPVASVGDLLIDGMRDPSLYERDTFNLDRIEVLRGSASMLFGRGSTGGVINQVSKKPMLSDQSELIGTVGSQGFYRSTIDLNKRIGETSALRINGMWNQADNGGAKIDKKGIAPTFSWGIGTRDEVSIGLYHQEYDNVPQSGRRYLANGTFFDGRAQSSIADIAPGNFYGAASDFTTGKASYVHASWAHAFDDGGQLNSQFRSGSFERELWTSVANFCNAAPRVSGNSASCGSPVNAATLSPLTFAYRSGLAPRNVSHDGTYFQSDYSNSYELGGAKHELIGGVDASSESAERYGSFGPVGTNFYKRTTRVGQPNDGYSALQQPLWRQTGDYSARSFGIFVQDLVQVAPHWKLLGGIRWDHFSGDFGRLSYANANTVVPRLAERAHLSDSMFSYRAGVLYQPTPTQSYHLSYGTSFNTSADTYQYVTPQNANTPPEKSRNIELGAKLDWLDGRLSTRAAIFRSEKFNERTTDADFAETTYLLSGKRHSQGIELEVVGLLAQDWEIYASYAYIPEAQIDRIGSRQANVVGSRVGLTPRNSGALWLSHQTTPKLRIAAGLRGASQNRPLQGTTGAASQTAYVPGYVVADLMLEYRFTPAVYAQLNVNNLGNRLFGDQLYPGFVVAGAERSVQATLGLRF